MRDFAAEELMRIAELPVAGKQERLERTKHLRDLFAIWDGARVAIRQFKGIGDPKPVLARNDTARRPRAVQASTPPPPDLVEPAQAA